MYHCHIALPQVHPTSTAIQTALDFLSALTMSANIKVLLPIDAQENCFKGVLKFNLVLWLHLKPHHHINHTNVF
jgi:hypothetical protein